jgi:hypothetical protein
LASADWWEIPDVNSASKFVGEVGLCFGGREIGAECRSLLGGGLCHPSQINGNFGQPQANQLDKPILRGV